MELDEEALIKRLKNKKVLTDQDLEILAKHERARYFGRVE